jgi:hypothetical protein
MLVNHPLAHFGVAFINRSIIMTRISQDQVPLVAVPNTSMESNNSHFSKLYLSSKEAVPDLAESFMSSSDDEAPRSVSPLSSDMPDYAPASAAATLLSVPEAVTLPSIVTTAVDPPPLVVEEARRKLQWEFKGLTIWLELEEFNNDITQAVEDLSCKHKSPFIPKPHTTAIYGMEHLSIEEAKSRLQRVRDYIPQWPTFDRPTGVTQDIAQVGRPGQVCSIAWSELTLSSNPDHEAALDKLYELFFNGPGSYKRDYPWKPHNSIAYDNPEDNTLSLLDTVMYIAERNPTLLNKERRVEAISLWSTVGKMEEWECLDRVRFW